MKYYILSLLSLLISVFNMLLYDAFHIWISLFFGIVSLFLCGWFSSKIIKEEKEN